MIRLALLGFPSVEEIVRKVVDLLFGALSQALLPDFLRDGTVDAIKWLIAVPNPADARLWPNVAEIESNMAALGFGLLGLTFVIAAVRYTLIGFASGPHPMVALSHAVAAAAGIVVYRWAFVNAVALVNVVTHQILSWPVVAHGLGRTVKVLFGGSLLVGSGSVFLSLLALVTIFFAVSLFVMKVAVLMLTAILYVAGPAVIALYPLPEAARFTRLWLYAALAVVLVPLGWCVIFATAGAISLDVTSFGDLGGQGTAKVVGAKTTGAFAGLLMFALAAIWPFKLGRHLGGIPAMSGIGTPAGAGGPAPLAAARVKSAQARLRAGVLATGGAAARAVGAAGAPRGGLAGAAVRGGSSLVGRAMPGASHRRPTGAARTAAVAAPGAPTSAVSATAPHGLKQRARAALAVVRDAPADIRAAVAGATASRHGSEPHRAPAGTRRQAASAEPPSAGVSGPARPPKSGRQSATQDAAPSRKSPANAIAMHATATRAKPAMDAAAASAPQQPTQQNRGTRTGQGAPVPALRGGLPVSPSRRSRKRRKQVGE